MLFYELQKFASVSLKDLDEMRNSCCRVECSTQIQWSKAKSVLCNQSVIVNSILYSSFLID